MSCILLFIIFVAFLQVWNKCIFFGHKETLSVLLALPYFWWVEILKIMNYDVLQLVLMCFRPSSGTLHVQVTVLHHTRVAGETSPWQTSSIRPRFLRKTNSSDLEFEQCTVRNSGGFNWISTLSTWRPCFFLLGGGAWRTPPSTRNTDLGAAGEECVVRNHRRTESDRQLWYTSSQREKEDKRVAFRPLHEFLDHEGQE